MSRPHPTAPHTTPPATILVIEDNEDMRENIASILQLSHYQVLTAANGKIGVELAQKNLPDLVLCDVMMPELDGYGVIHILRKDPLTSGIPFVFLTAKSDKSDFRAGMNLGADDYLTKPFDGLDLLKVVEVRLKRDRLLRTNFSDEEGDLSSFFSQARELKECQRLSENRPTRKFKKKDLIFMEGQTPNDVYFISHGNVKTYKINYDGKELITSIHGPGEFLGYVALLEEKPYGENAEALDDTELVIIPKEDFTSLIYSSKDVARKFIKMLSNNLEETENRLLELAYQSVRQRVARALLKINGTGTTKDAVIAIARRDISNLIGTATESLNRTLADFRDEGLIEISEAGLRIINKEKLERLLQ